MRCKVVLLPSRSSHIALDARSAPAPHIVPVEKKTTPKTVKVAFDNTPWRKVFEWAHRSNGQTVITNFQPTGSFTFQGPPTGIHYP